MSDTPPRFILGMLLVAFILDLIAWWLLAAIWNTLATHYGFVTVSTAAVAIAMTGLGLMFHNSRTEPETTREAHLLKLALILIRIVLSGVILLVARGFL